MESITQVARTVLEPYVGIMVADTCIRATAISLGKTSDELGLDDGAALMASMRKLLAPIAPPAAIDEIIRAFDLHMRGVM